MKSVSKKLFSLFLAFVIIIGVMGGYTTFAALSTDKTGNCGKPTSAIGINPTSKAKYTYSETTQTLTITGTGDIMNYSNTVKRPWNDYASDITTIVIGEGITGIGRNNFSDFTALTSVTLPSTLKLIDGLGVAGTDPEEEITGLTYGAFQGCTSLENITLPDGLQELGECAFYKCTALKKIVLPNSLKTLGKAAFRGCTNLSSATYGTGLTSTGNQAFMNSGLNSVVLPSTVTAVDLYSFFNTKFTAIELGDSIASIGLRSFANCEFLKTVTINNPNCTFTSNPFSRATTNQLDFYGHKGSTTETYVNNNPNSNFAFHSLDNCDHLNTHEEITKDATCTTEGTKSVVCDDCGLTISSSTIAALGHDWEETSTDDQSEKNGHKYVTSTCKRCSETKTEIQHVSFVEGYYTFSSTVKNCAVGGIETKTCTFTGCGKVDRTVVAPGTHTIEDYTVTQEATCTQTGTKTGTCTVCGKTDCTETIPALGHDYELKTTIDSVDTDGHKYETYICKRCQAAETKIVHVEWKDGYYTSATVSPSSCTIPGYVKDTCSVEGCGETRRTEIPAKDHEYEETDRVEPKCTSRGTITYTCKNCGAQKQENIAALGHDLSLVESECVAATCTESGTNVYVCNRCGVKQTDTISPLGHTPDENHYTLISDPTCTTDGSAKSICTVCGSEFDISIQALGHNYEDVVTAIDDKPGHSLVTPTCTRCNTKDKQTTRHDEWIDGYYTTKVITNGNTCTIGKTTEDTCKICSLTRRNTTEVPGHSYVSSVDSNGRIVYTCSVCQNEVSMSPVLVLQQWNISYVNTTPTGKNSSYMFEIVNDGVINAKDYAQLKKLADAYSS